MTIIIAVVSIFLIWISFTFGERFGYESFGYWGLGFFFVLSVFGITLKAVKCCRPSVTTVVFIIASLGLFYWALGSYEGSWFSKVMLMCFLVAPVMAITNAFHRVDMRRAQKGRDAKATAIVSSCVENGSTSEIGLFAFYLRPFAITDRLSGNILPADEFMALREEYMQHVDIETFIDRAIRYRSPLIALGRENEPEILEGAGRVRLPDDNWEEPMRRIAARAEFLLMVPLAYDGTLRELDWVAQTGLIEKTIFLMPEPPNVVRGGVWTSRMPSCEKLFDAGFTFYDQKTHNFDLIEEWTKARAAAAERGIELPWLAQTGAIFRFDPITRKPLRIAPLALSTMSKKIFYLREALAYVLNGWRPNDQPTDLVKSYEAGVFFSGNTRISALIQAADAYVQWGNTAVSIEFLKRADIKHHLAKPSLQYAKQFPSIIKECRAHGYDELADKYLTATDAIFEYTGDPFRSTTSDII
jgi:hypothetical protein